MVEVYLMTNDKAEELRLPVPPSEFGPDSGLDVQTANVHSLGEVALIGKPTLRVYALESYFPVRADHLCQYTSFPPPAECVDMIERWRASGLPVRLIITGASLDVNTLVSIPEFAARVKAGVEDVWFTMTLQEYRERLPRLATDGGMTRPMPGDIGGGTYIVIKGDTIKSVAKKLCGSSKKWKELAKKNGLSTKKVPKLKAGQELIF